MTQTATSGGTAASADLVALGLARVLDALARGDAEGACAAAQETADACASLQARGIQLERSTLAALADACARAEAEAGSALRALGGELATAARSRRAADAYGAAPTSAQRDLP